MSFLLGACNCLPLGNIVCSVIESHQVPEHIPLPWGWYLGIGRRIGTKYGTKGFCLHEIRIAESFSEGLRRDYVQTLHGYNYSTKDASAPIETDIGSLGSLWPPLAWGHEDILEANFPAIEEFLPEHLIKWISKRKVEDWTRAVDNIYCLSSWYLFYWWFLFNLEGKTFLSLGKQLGMAHGNAARRHAVAFADATYWSWNELNFSEATQMLAMATATQRSRIDLMEPLADYVTETPPWFS